MVVMLVVARGTKMMSMAQKFSFLKDTSCTINVESRPLKTTFGWPEGHGLGLSEGDNIIQFH
jgi:hypothetical protein